MVKRIFPFLSIFDFEFCAGENDRPFRLNIVQLLSTDSNLPLSSQRWLSFFFDSWLLLPDQSHRSGPSSFEFSSVDQYRV